MELWNVNTDTFTFRVSTTERPYIKRGVLSTVNSIFDPMGFIAPVVVVGKCILRDVVFLENMKWDDTLPPEWEKWKNSLQCLEQLQIPRTILPMSFNDAETKELHVFVDVSERVITVSSYIKTVHCVDTPYCGFVLGKAKVAPCHGHTIPRLELCAAVLGIDIALLVTRHMNMSMDHVQYHTNSKIVLGYITNSTKRFSVYVTNRVEKIRRCSKPSQWRYVSTSTNPADQATRPVPAISLNGNAWLVGPSTNSLDVDIEKDMEFKSDVKVTVTKVCSHKVLGSDRFERFSRWDTLVRSFAPLKALAKSYHKDTKVHTEIPIKHPLLEAEMYLIRVIQQKEYKREYECITSRPTIRRDSSILSLSPELDSDGMLRVKGRLSNSQLSSNEKYPLIIPGKHHVATLLVRHYHEKVHHQGRHFTEGAIRAAGLWITGAKRLVSSMIYQCLTCRKLRGKQEQQILSDLPQDHVVPAPPFSNVGVDTFGPWNIASRKTRRGHAHSKRWAVPFTCLTTRAIHIEVVEEMSSSSFINAHRRFVALRGNVRVFRSDRGTNFVGATEALGIHRANVENPVIHTFLVDNRAYWLFNPPHSFRMGGV